MKSLSHVRLFETPCTAAHQAPLSMGFPRQEYWSGIPLPSLKNRAQMLNCQSGMGSLYQVIVNRKLKISLSDLFNATSCHLFFFFFAGCLDFIVHLVQGTGLWGMRKAFNMAWIVKSGILSTSLLVFCCFDVLVDSVVLNSL